MTSQARVAQLIREGMDNDAAMRTVDYERLMRESIERILGSAEPECYGDCEDRYCPYTH